MALRAKRSPYLLRETPCEPFFLATAATHPLWYHRCNIQSWEGCMSAYNQHQPRGPVAALRHVVAGLASGLN